MNSHPHIGHAYTTVIADIFARYQKLFGLEVFLLTGTDEHGQKIEESAKKANIPSQQFVDTISKEFQDLWTSLGIEYDQFIRTTNECHKKRVQDVLSKLYETGEIFLKEYEGLYCVGCERFLDAEELQDGLCVDHGVSPQIHKEENYFFRMSAYQEWLIDTIHQNPDWIYPDQYRNEVLGFLRHPLQDLCISRPKKRVSWGIELPFDTKFVTYVWFDALLNYPNALGDITGLLFQKFWKEAHHVIGKDILKTHAIYWPCMLKAANLPLFKKLVVHGHWNCSGAKMSKTLGNVVDPLQMKDMVGCDGLRFFLARDMSFGSDAIFTEDLLTSRYNTDLANNLGNLVSRVVKLSQKYFAECTPPKKEAGDLEQELARCLQEKVKQVKEYIDTFKLHQAVENIMEMCVAVNKYLDQAKPWKMAKKSEGIDPLAVVLYTALDGIRLIAHLLSPVMPQKASDILDLLGMHATEQKHLKLGLLQENLPLKKMPNLFPRLQSQNIQQTSSKEFMQDTTLDPENRSTNEITIEDFDRIILKVGKILACQNIPKANRLLHSTVDIGESEPRSIVSGIAEFYQPEELVGKLVVVVSNLKAVKLRGVLSQGMLLCVDSDKNLALVEPPESSKVGSRIS